MAPGVVSPPPQPIEAQARDRLAAGDAVLGVGVADAGPVEGVRDDRGLAVADQHLVDQRRPEHLAPVDADVVERLVVERRDLQRERVLVALVGVGREREAREQLVVRRGVPVEPQVALVRAGRELRLAHVVAGDTAHVPVRQRVVRGVVQDRERRRADAAERDLVAGERLPGERVPDRGRDARQVAVAPGLGRDRGGREARGVLARALVVGEEEQLVLDQRAAERRAEDVLLALLARRVGAVVLPGVRVEVAVPVELEHVAAELRSRPT